MEPAPTTVQYCSECGQPWPQEELARFGDRLICSNCKIAYAQKLREGVASAATFTYAGFWIRFVAVLLDGIILFVAGVVVQLGFAPMLRSGRMDLALMALGAEYLIGMAIGATYEGLFVSRFGATPGKMALDLKVVRPDGGPISLGRAVGRYFAKIVSGIILMVTVQVPQSIFLDKSRGIGYRRVDECESGSPDKATRGSGE
jgi:uncharacterized RDD family membrane protein YckC